MAEMKRLVSERAVMVGSGRSLMIEYRISLGRLRSEVCGLWSRYTGNCDMVAISSCKVLWFSLIFIWDMMTENGKSTGQGEEKLKFQITKISKKKKKKRKVTVLGEVSKFFYIR